MGLKRPPAQDVAFPQHLVDVGQLRRGHAEEVRLHVHRLIERKIFAVHHHRGARVLVQFAQSADMVNVCMGAHDRFYRELVASQKIEDSADFIARIDNQSFAGEGITDDRAIALENPHGNGDMDQSFRGGIQGGQAVAHTHNYIIGEERISKGCCIGCGCL